MFCSGCLKRLPSFVATAPSALETMRRRELDASRGAASNAAVRPTSTPVSFPLWLPAVLLAMCAAFFGWVASMTAVSPARLLVASPSSPENIPPTVSTLPSLAPSPLPAVDSLSRIQDRAEAIDVLAPAADENDGNARAKEADALAVVWGFYRALASGDGAAASAVAPGRRDFPAFREERISRFYGSLREPLSLESLRPIAANRFEAKYSYRATRTPCRATAIVETEVVGERTFIRRIHATC